MTDEERQRAAQFCDNARYFLALGTERALQSALYFFDQALAVDPRCAAAFAGKARCYAEIGDGAHMMPPLPQLRALDFANRALALERSTEACVVRAKALAELCYTFDEARAELALLPDGAEVGAMRSLLATYRGRFDEALAATNALLPRAIALLYARRAREAIAMLERAETNGSCLWSVPTMLGLAHYLDGETENAIDTWERARRAHPAASAYLLYAYGAHGRREHYAALRAELDKDARATHRSPFWDALAALGAGGHAEATASLERGLAMRDPWMARLAIEPMLDPLRGQPAFERLARVVRDGTELPPRPGT